MSFRRSNENTSILTVFLRRLSADRNQNSPRARTVDFCLRYARKTVQIILPFSCGIAEPIAKTEKIFSIIQVCQRTEKFFAK